MLMTKRAKRLLMRIENSEAAKKLRAKRLEMKSKMATKKAAI